MSKNLSLNANTTRYLLIGLSSMTLIIALVVTALTLIASTKTPPPVSPGSSEERVINQAIDLLKTQTGGEDR